jgi:hypothetical protein
MKKRPVAFTSSFILHPFFRAFAVNPLPGLFDAAGADSLVWSLV